MKQPSKSQNDITAVNERLAKTFYSNGRYNPVLLAVAGLGFAAIFLLTQFGILGEPAPQLLYIGVITLLYAVAEIPVLALARHNKGIAANFYGSIITGMFAILLTLFWHGIALVAILIALITPVMALTNGLPRKYISRLFLLLIVIVNAILYANLKSPFERLENSSSAAIAGIIFLVATGILLLGVTTISQSRKFHSIQGLLLTSFVIIVTITIFMTVALSAVGAYTSNQTQTFSTLQAIATLKENQIKNLLSDFQNDTRVLLADPEFSTNALESLKSGGITPEAETTIKSLARSRMVDVLGGEEEAYNEIMVLNAQGDVVVSTLSLTEGTSFAKQPFFREGSLGFFAGFSDEPSFGTDNLIIAAPILDEQGQAIQGILVLRSNAAPVKRIMENTPGFTESETYLVDVNFKPVTKTLAPIKFINTQATSEAVLKNVSQGKAIYLNYADHQVLGYYEWFQPMQLAMIAEVPVNFVLNNSLKALTGSALLALFVAAIAIAAVAVSARAIADPIKTLAQTSESFAAGKLSTRAMVDRQDEIGALASAFNQMASQLQEIIGKLEKRVADRTQDLENQSFRLRVAAEIGRDAASSRDLHELLARAADLIINRFNFYHIGIFLLDSNKEYAVLVASPTEAGRQMIENDHKLRVGEVGIVGRVSATGEPRITLNTGDDAVYFNNPYLPQTRSEMALPLKVENNVIGVLDVQSDQPQAFNEEDIAIMQVMADQLATAIERTRLLQEVEKNLKELEGAYGQFTRDNWKKLSNGTSAGNMGYRFDNVRLEPISKLPELADDAFKTGTIISSNGSHLATNKEQTVAIPIKLREQTIGVVSIKLKEGYDSNTISIIESAVERLASAMESARLYEEARMRADRELSISRVTTAISASTEYEQILQTTVREIGNILSDTEVAIQILEEPAGVKRPERREQ
jgi:putative methionine-R-sulfoxide reductase with GAF domain/HAMP domain-containing protein